MLKLAQLIVKNIGRNKRRTILTALAVVALVAIFSTVNTVTRKASELFSSYSSQTRLVVQERWTVPSRFPVRYVPQIAQVHGVKDWTTWNFYGGTLDDAGHEIGGVATRAENLTSMHPGLEAMDRSCLETLKRERTGAILGPQLMRQMGWRIGQRFTVKSGIPGLPDLPFKVVGVLPSGLWDYTFFFRDDYYREGTGQRDLIAMMWLQVADVETGKQVAADVDAMFRNAPTELKIETESAGMARIGGHLRTVVNIVNFVAVVLLVNMVTILANSISMTVRERQKEMAILKTLGFAPRLIATLVIAEAMLVGGVSGLLGGGLAWLASLLNTSGRLPVRLSYLEQFPVTPEYLFYGAIVGALVGFAGSVVPAWRARNVRIADVFSRVV